jgi:predicted RNA binding protein YcfA (HicA-like mRNA interferase family)
MSRLIPISPRNLEKKIIRLGFQPVRQKGSHVFYKHPDGRCTTIQFHAGCDIGPVMLAMILKDIKISREEYQRL